MKRLFQKVFSGTAALLVIAALVYASGLPPSGIEPNIADEALVSQSCSGNSATATTATNLNSSTVASYEKIKVGTATVALSCSGNATSATNADTLDNQHGSYYLTPSNLSVGTNEGIRVGTATIATSLTSTLVANYQGIKVGTSTISLSCSGNAATATSATTATTATNLDSNTVASYEKIRVGTATVSLSCSGNAATATSATNADTVDNQHGSYYLTPSNWSVGTNEGVRVGTATVSISCSGNAASSSNDFLGKVSDTDTTAAKLGLKILPGSGVNISVQNSGANENLYISQSAAGAASRDLFAYGSQNSDISGYTVLLTTPNPTSAVSTTTISSIANGTIIVSSRATLSGYPGITRINAGVVSWHFYAAKSGTKTISVVAYLYKRTAGGVETLLASSAGEPQTITSTITGFEATGAMSDTTLNSTDRLVSKLVATVSGAPATDLILYSEGLRDTHISIPIVQAHTHTIAEIISPQAQLFNAVYPAGQYIEFASTIAPAGYNVLYCNGASVSTTTYSALFAVIGFTYGNPGGGNMKLPDRRGLFARGFDDGRGIDADSSFRVFGSTQADSFQAHKHEMNYDDNGTAGTAAALMSSNATDGDDAGYMSNAFAVNASSGTPRTSAETRPFNISVCYFIKY